MTKFSRARNMVPEDGFGVGYFLDSSPTARNYGCPTALYCPVGWLAHLIGIEDDTLGQTDVLQCDRIVARVAVGYQMPKTWASDLMYDNDSSGVGEEDGTTTRVEIYLDYLSEKTLTHYRKGGDRYGPKL